MFEDSMNNRKDTPGPEVFHFLPLASADTSSTAKPIEKPDYKEARSFEAPKTACPSKDIYPAVSEPEENQADVIDSLIKDSSSHDLYQAASGSQQDREEEAKTNKGNARMNMQIDLESSQQSESTPKATKLESPKLVGKLEFPSKELSADEYLKRVCNFPGCDLQYCDAHYFVDHCLQDDDTHPAVSGSNQRQAEQTILEPTNQEINMDIDSESFQLHFPHQPVVLSSSVLNLSHSQSSEETSRDCFEEFNGRLILDSVQTPSQSAPSPSRREYHDFANTILLFLRDFNLKEENIKQTVVRQFKFCMKQISKDLNRYKKLSSKKYLMLTKRTMKLYCINIEKDNIDLAQNLILNIKSLIGQIDPEIFRATYMRKKNCPDTTGVVDEEEKSCNSTYIRYLFSSQIMKDLYHLHHSLASKGQIYFEKFKQFKEQSLTGDQKEQVFNFCGSFLDYYV